MSTKFAAGKFPFYKCKGHSYGQDQTTLQRYLLSPIFNYLPPPSSGCEPSSRITSGAA